jgi:GT2 family glycosyltransferase
MLRIVTATRHDGAGFRTQTLLGRSLHRLRPGHASIEVTCQNTTAGLPEIYNAALDEAREDDTVVCVHDDVRLDDWLLGERLAEALNRFQVVGVAGNARRVPGQPSWFFRERDADGGRLVRDDPAHWRGVIVHRTPTREAPSFFGPTPAPVALLDGVFLAMRPGSLRRAGVAFDPVFRFHFYDLDFCRQCEEAGLAMGVWPIALTHGSGGNCGGPDWEAGYHRYLTKWGGV